MSHLTKIGSELDTVFNAIHYEVRWLYLKWDHYRTLFGAKPWHWFGSRLKNPLPHRHRMSIRTTVGRWHGGQLVIAWVVLGMIGFGSLLFGDYLSGNHRENRSLEQQIALGVELGDTNKFPPLTDASTRSDSAAYIRRYELLDAAAKKSVEDEYNQWDSRMYLFFWLAIPGALLVSGLLVTWWWLGSRTKSPTAST